MVIGTSYSGFVVGLRKRLQKRGFLEDCHTQDLENCVETLVETELFLDDRNENIHRYRDPDLRLHGVFGGAVKGLDSQVLFDPFEKEFDAPPRLVELSHSQCGKIEAVGEEDLSRIGVGIVIANAAQRFGIVFRGVKTG